MRECLQSLQTQANTVTVEIDRVLPELEKGNGGLHDFA